MNGNNKESRRGHRKGQIAKQLGNVKAKYRVARIIMLTTKDLQFSTKCDHRVEHAVEETDEGHHEDDAHVLLGVLLLTACFIKDVVEGKLPEKVLGGWTS